MLDFYMGVPYHEQMHTARSGSGSWKSLISLRGFDRDKPQPNNHSPGDRLKDLTNIQPWHPDAVAPSYLSPTGTIPTMGTFSEQMCTVAEHLHRQGNKRGSAGMI